MESSIIHNIKKEISDKITDASEDKKGKEGDLKKEMIQKIDSKHALNLKNKLLDFKK